MSIKGMRGWRATALMAVAVVAAGAAPTTSARAQDVMGAERERAELQARMRGASAEMAWALQRAQIAGIEARRRAEMALARAGQGVELAELRAGVEAARMRTAAAVPRIAGISARTSRMAAELNARMHRETGRAVRSQQLALRAERAERDMRTRAPEPWLQQDPADSLYRAARAALNGRDYLRSAELFGAIRDRYPDSGYAPDAHYFEALALQRAGGSTRLQRALELIEVMRRQYPDAPTAEDARALQLRIRSQLARRGDPRSAMEVAEQASAECDSPDQDLRAAALSALLNMDADQAVPILQEVLRSRDECSAELRRRAIFILSQKMDDEESVDLLLDLAYRNPDPDREVREQAVFWLSQVRSEEALRALESILRASDADEELQEKALFAISQHRSEAALDILKEYAERPDAPTNLRENAIFWIGQSPRAGGAAYLMELYDGIDDRELREKIVFGVAQAGDEAAGRWLLERARDADEDPEIRKNALFWAGQTGVVGVPDLVEMYGSMPEVGVKEQIIFVLSQKKGEAAVDALMDIARDEEDVKLREKAVFWLGQSKDPRVPEFLLQLIRGGGEVR